MAKNKYDFIKELLEDKKLNQNQRKRILELASKEISLEGSLEERVQKIEGILFNKQDELMLTELEGTFKIGNKEKFFKKDMKNQIPSLSPSNEENNLSTYINPYNAYKFLLEYNQDIILKTTCHNMDADLIDGINKLCGTDKYDFNKHLEKIKEAYQNLTKRNFVSGKLSTLIHVYLTGEDYNGNASNWAEGISINWCSDELHKWIKQNPEVPPNLSMESFNTKGVTGFRFKPFVSKITGKRISNFTELVIHFKKLFHIRFDNSFIEVFTNVNERWAEQMDISIVKEKFPDNIEHFVDVSKLIQAYEKILKLIVEKSNEKPKIELSLFRDEDALKLYIHNANGKPSKEIQDFQSRRFGNEGIHLINKLINGLCNYYFEADFGDDKSAKLNLWNGKVFKPEYLHEPINGVRHTFEFPLKS